MLNKVRYCDPCMQWIVPAHLNSQIGGLLKRCCKYGYCLKIETLEDVIESKLFKDITTFRACLLTSFCCLLSYHIPASYRHSSQHQSVVGSPGLHNLSLPRFQRRCRLSLELTPIWHSR